MRTKCIVTAIAFVTASLTGVVAQSGVAHAEQVVSSDCGGGWIGWAEYRDYGDDIEIRIRPTKRAWAGIHAGGVTVAAPIWDAFFNCIGWDDGFDRLSEDQWSSLWNQHRCHLALGGFGRVQSGDTFDYESWHPNRETVWNALTNYYCN